jgi:O-antigen ligase
VTAPLLPVTSAGPLVPARLVPLGWLPPVLAVGAVLLLLTTPYPGSVLLCAAGAIGIIAALSPAWGVTFLAAAIPVNNVGSAAVGPVTFTLFNALLIGLLIGWTLNTFALRRPLRLSPVALPLLAYLVVCLATYPIAHNTGGWGNEVYSWGIALGVFVIATQTIRTRLEVWRIVAVMALGTIAVSGYAAWQVMEDMGPSSYRVGGLLRAYATFGGPNSFAKYLEMTVPLMAALSGAWLVAVMPWLGRSGRVPVISRTIPWWVGLLATGGTLAGLLALFLTQSRGGWVGMAAGLAVVALLLGGVYRWTFIFGVFALIMLAILTPLGDLIALRFGSEALGIGSSDSPVNVSVANWAVQERLAHYRAGLHMVRDHPWLGVGAGNFNERFREFTEVWRFRIPRGHAHNAYIQVAAQTGIVGLVTYLSLIVTVATRLRSRWRIGVGSDRVVVIGAIGVSVAVAVHNVFDYLHVAALPIQLSLIWALAERVRTNRGNPAPRGTAKGKS